MKIEAIPFNIELVRGSLPVIGDGKRSEGLHLTDIIRDINEQVDPLPESVLNAYAALGFAYEKVIEGGIANACLNDRYIRIGELVKDGIIGSPDLVDVDSWIIVDTKLKWCSSKHAGGEGDSQEQIAELMTAKFWKEIVQIKSYCHMLSDIKPCNVGELWFCFVCGDWRGKPPSPQWMVRRLTFTNAELKDNWKMLTEHAMKRGWL